MNDFAAHLTKPLKVRLDSDNDASTVPPRNHDELPVDPGLTVMAMQGVGTDQDAIMDKPSSSGEVSDAFIQELTHNKSSATYDKWLARYEIYANQRNVNLTDVTTFLNWMRSLKNIDKFANSTVISGASCVNSRLKVSHNVNFMGHVLVKPYQEIFQGA